MSETNKNNFDGLKQLLKLKQHEVPPPGYFNRFSDEVVSRIRAGESGGADGFLGYGSWLTNFLQAFQAKPGLIGGVATGLCLLLLVSVVLADRPDVESSAGDMAGAQAAPADGTALASAVPLMPADGSGIAISTNPVVSLQPVATLFGSQQNPLFQTAGFIPASQ